MSRIVIQLNLHHGRRNRDSSVYAENRFSFRVDDAARPEQRCYPKSLDTYPEHEGRSPDLPT